MAHDIERTEQFEHTRAICYFVAWPYMGKNPPAMHEWWHLNTDRDQELDKEMAKKYMKWLTEQYAAGLGTYTFEEFLENSKIAN